MMDITQRKFSNTPYPEHKKGVPINVFNHMRQFPPLDYKDVVRPNFDTLYSTAFIDVSKEPMVLSIPDAKGRYYLIPAMDMWTDNFASPGWRTTGTKKQTVMYVKQDWNGKAPKGVQVIKCPTDMIWVIARVGTQGEKDYAAVRKFQDGMVLKPLSHWKSGKSYNGYMMTEKNFDIKTPPKKRLIKMKGKEFFAIAAELMKKYPPHMTDYNTVARMKYIGIEPGKSFNYKKLNNKQSRAIRRAPMAVLKDIQRTGNKGMGVVENNWSVYTHSMGVYGNEYDFRTKISLIGLGANQPADAIYPLTKIDNKGKKLNTGKTYKVHFAKKDLPPVGAFWSFTVYDEQGFTRPNRLNKATVSSWMPLKYNADGSLDLIFSNKEPKGNMKRNWYPLEDFGTFNLTMRLYAPDLEKIDNGKWVPPVVQNVSLAH